MKILERGFSKRETVLFLVLVALLLTLAYIQFVDRPVRSAIETAKAEQESLLSELDAVNSRAARLEEMQQELDGMDSTRHQSIMGSYNNEKEELEILNSILHDLVGNEHDLVDLPPDLRICYSGIELPHLG